MTDSTHDDRQVSTETNQSNDPPPVLVVCCGERHQVAVDGAAECPSCATTHWVQHSTSVQSLELLERNADEDYDFWACPTCSHPICDWCDCPECGWMNGDIWESTLGESPTLATDGGQVETGRRARVAITTVPGDRDALVTSTERLERLLEAIELWGPEPEGIVVDVDRDALDELPPAWEVEYLTTNSPLSRCGRCGRPEVLVDTEPVDVGTHRERVLCRRCR